MMRSASRCGLKKFAELRESLLCLAALAVALPGPGLAGTISEPVALLQGLDKITARVSKFEAPVGTAPAVVTSAPAVIAPIIMISP